MLLKLPEEGKNMLTGEDREIFMRAFLIVQRELGLEDAPNVVRICFNEVERNGDYLLMGSLERIAGRKPEEPYRIDIGRAGPMLGQEIQTMCHEMIHVEQHFKGWLSDPDEETVLWKGQAWTRERAAVADFFNRGGDYPWRSPWEQDAHQRTNDLFAKVMVQLSENDVKYLAKQVEIATHGKRASLLKKLIGTLGDPPLEIKKILAEAAGVDESEIEIVSHEVLGPGAQGGVAHIRKRKVH
jgi:hypothetical protein